jgi:hypothetical protein
LLFLSSKNSQFPLFCDRMDISFDAIVISLAPLFPSAIHVIQDFIKQFCDSRLLSFFLRKISVCCCCVYGDIGH